MAAIKCPHCGSNSALQIHVPHVDHGVLHLVTHHAGTIAKQASRHPLTALFGLVAGAVAVVGNAFIEGEYQCSNSNCRKHFKA